ncbi:MAG: competence/damage-inducible protein A, partial [Pseudomonadota bacterium]
MPADAPVAERAHSDAPTTGMLVIGDEILSGRTIDANLVYAAPRLAALGAPIQEARVIADDIPTIVAALNALRTTCDQVITSGGIGPTHDDKTAEAVAAAFGRPLVRSADAEARLRAHIGGELNAARLKMAEVPEGAELIDNPVSAAPGFRVENVYVFAGVPSIFRAMFDAVAPNFVAGPPLVSRSISAFVREGDLAAPLTDIAATYA